MKLSLLKHKVYNPGSKEEISKEEILNSLDFNIHVFNKFDKNNTNTIYISSFSEFGCELVTIMYCIPRIKRRYPTKKIVVCGWYGRSYLYQHLVDEFWEIKEEFQYLREYCRAFHHDSKNIKNFENHIKTLGNFISTNDLGKIAVTNYCLDCKVFFNTNVNECPNTECKSNNIEKELFRNVIESKKERVEIPFPNNLLYKEYINKLDKNKNYIGVFARNRQCWGRNLDSNFYIGLINTIRNNGFEPIWFGEEISTLPCPDDSVLSFRGERNLELVLSLIRCCFCTIQFWTASTRLAGIMGVPYILFESPDQIWGNGQEGIRRNLCDLGPSKLISAHYFNIKNNHQLAYNAFCRAINEMMESNYNDLIIEELIDNYESVLNMKNSSDTRIGKDN